MYTTMCTQQYRYTNNYTTTNIQTHLYIIQTTSVHYVYNLNPTCLQHVCKHEYTITPIQHIYNIKYTTHSIQQHIYTNEYTTTYIQHAYNMYTTTCIQQRIYVNIYVVCNTIFTTCIQHVYNTYTTSNIQHNQS